MRKVSDEQSVCYREKIFQTGPVLASAAPWLVRYSLVLVIVWIGGIKFTALEVAEKIRDRLNV